MVRWTEEQVAATRTSKLAKAAAPATSKGTTAPIGSWVLLCARLCAAWMNDLRLSADALRAVEQSGSERILMARHDSIARLREQITEGGSAEEVVTALDGIISE